MYNWYVLGSNNICPEGWHLLNNADWTILINYLGGDTLAGGKIKGNDSWIYPNVGATNETNFTAMPGGSRAYYGSFVGIKLNTSWWSASDENGTDVWITTVGFSTGETDRGHYNKGTGASIRCIKN